MDETSAREIEKRIEFDAPIERVWRAITEPDELAAWFGHEADFRAVPGYDGAMVWHEHGSFALRVEEVEAPRRLVWSWVHEAGVAFEEAPSTRVEWLLSEQGEGRTVLIVRETGFRTELHHRQNTEGWAEELGELVAWLSA